MNTEYVEETFVILHHVQSVAPMWTVQRVNTRVGCV
jgi:hypothetical protein